LPAAVSAWGFGAHPRLEIFHSDRRAASPFLAPGPLFLGSYLLAVSAPNPAESALLGVLMLPPLNM